MENVKRYKIDAGADLRDTNSTRIIFVKDIILRK